MALIFSMVVVEKGGARIDFGQGKQGANWQIVNDGVMGGLSQGRGGLTDSTLVFSGRVSLENNGGFASLRSPWARYDFADYEEVKIRYRLEGVGFAMVIETSPRWYEVNYKKTLPEKDGEWTIATLSLNEFKAYQVGRKLSNTLDEGIKSQVLRFGFISDEKRADEFLLEIDWIEFR